MKLSSSRLLLSASILSAMAFPILAAAEPQMSFQWRFKGLVASAPTEQNDTIVSAPFNISFDTNSSTLSGQAQENALVRVIDESENTIGSGFATSGTFSIQVSSASLGETVKLQAQDSTGKLSAFTSFNLPVAESPPPPIPVTSPSIDSFSPDGSEVIVSVDNGNSVFIYDSGNNLIGSRNGSGSLTLDPSVKTGDTLIIYATDANGVKSDELTFTVPEGVGLEEGPLKPTPQNIGVKGVFEGHESAGEIIYGGTYSRPSNPGQSWHLFIEDPQESARSTTWATELLLTSTAPQTTSAGMHRQGYVSPQLLEDGYYTSWKLAINPNGVPWNTPARHCTRTLSNLNQTPDAWFQPSLEEMRFLSTTVADQMVIDNASNTGYWSVHDISLAQAINQNITRNTRFDGSRFSPVNLNKSTSRYSFCARRTII